MKCLLGWKATVLGIATLAIVAGCERIARKFSPESDVSVDNDRRARIGMTREQVIARLGAASRTNLKRSNAVWHTSFRGKNIVF